MATFLDVSLLQSVSSIFPVLLVFTIVFAVLQKTKAVSENVSINAVIAAVVGFLVLLSDTAVKIINFMIPWFTVAMIFLILLLLIFQMFGAKEENIFAALKGERGMGIIWVIIGVGLIILIAAFANVFGQSYLGESSGTGTTNASGVATVNGSSVATGSFDTNLTSTLFNTKVLGILVLFGIIVFAVLLITKG